MNLYYKLFTCKASQGWMMLVGLCFIVVH